MTSPINESAAQPRAESFVDWFHINSRIVTAGAVVVAAAAFGYWIVQRTAYNETISADRQLLVAKQSLNSGNEKLPVGADGLVDRKSTRLNSSHTVISYALFCFKK